MYKEFRHHIPVQVRFKDVDKQGHVNNANHLTYFETARVAYFVNVLGKEVDWDKTGVLLARTEIDYLEPIFLEDEIIVFTRVSKTGNKSFEMSNCIVKKSKDGLRECANGKSVFVCYDYLQKQSIEIPAVWRERFEQFETQKA